MAWCFIQILVVLFCFATQVCADYKYQAGFGNEFQSEALEGALPLGQNSPQKPPYGLYAEQLSGTPFTKKRALNQRTWLYRIQPSVIHGAFAARPHPSLLANFLAANVTPKQLRWKPWALPSAGQATHFVDGLISLAGTGDPAQRNGLAIYYYSANQDMTDSVFYNSDGDFLIVPQLGTLDIQTELGFLQVAPGEICVIPRGVCYRVKLTDGQARGYICEVFDGHFTLPELGPIGANGLANARDFLYPVAAFEDLQEPHTMLNKFQGEVFEAQLGHSPFNVVAFHGNYLPFKYDLSRFCALNSVSFDHPDPSIFTVLTCSNSATGQAVLDFAIFPPRWSVSEHTFRPPYFHRNCMSEFMGLIQGAYEAKSEGFLPGGASLHSCMTPHGPDQNAYAQWREAPLEPQFIQEGDLAFMFESPFQFKLTDAALETQRLDTDYHDCWQGLEKYFDEAQR